MSEAIRVNGDARWDSEYFKKNYIKTDYFLKSKMSLPFNTFCQFIKKGIFDLSPDNYNTFGVPFIRTSEIKNPLIDFTTTVYLDSDTHYNNYKTILKAYDLVFTKIGANIGDVAILPHIFSDYNFSQNVAGASIKDKANSPYLLTYFLSNIGKSQLLRCSMLSGQGKLELEDIRNLRVILVTDYFKEKIAQIIDTIERSDYRSCQLYSNAEDLLLKELAFEDWQHYKDNISVKTLRESFFFSGRLDAEYYQSKYDVFFEKLERLETKRLSHIVNIEKSIEPGSDYYQTDGIPFIRVADITKYGITKPAIYLDKNIFRDAIRPKMNTILMSKDGSVGIAYKVEKDEDIITSGAILHLTIKDEGVLPDYLTLVINSEAVQMQAERDAGGSIIQHWKPSEIENVVIPILPIDEQIKISEMVQESFRLRNESKRLLEVAKKAVEIAISESEEVALMYLKENENG